MQIDPAAEWTRLTRLYAEKSDEELLDLATDFGNLTDTAQSVLRDELRKRKLEEPHPTLLPTGTKPPKPRSAAGSDPVFGPWNRANAEENAAQLREEEEDTDLSGDDRPVEYTWKTLLCECDEEGQAEQFKEVLRRAKINSWIVRPHQRSFDMRDIRVMVAADELEEARAIIAQPIPDEVIEQWRVSVEDFTPPTCPKCRAEDPLLESIDPTNSWLCETCGARWTDPPPVENEGPNSH